MGRDRQKITLFPHIADGYHLYRGLDSRHMDGRFGWLVRIHLVLAKNCDPHGCIRRSWASFQIISPTGSGIGQCPF